MGNVRGRLTGALSLAALLLSGCGTVDEFAPRAARFNDNASTAATDNILRNIIRTSLAEPVSFVSVSKITASRLADLKIGVPTLTFGKNQTAAQKQFVFSGNVLDNSMGYSLELSQLGTSEFTDALMTPLPPDNFENLAAQGFSRELISYLLIDSVELRVIGVVDDRNDKTALATAIRNALGDGTTDKHPPKITETIVYHNDPTLDDPARCPTRDFSAFFNQYAPLVPHHFAPTDADAYAPAVTHQEGRPDPCEFHSFQFLVAEALRYGMRFEPKPDAGGNDGAQAAAALPDAPTPPASTGKKADPASSAPAVAQPATKWQLCYDPNAANQYAARYMAAVFHNMGSFSCGAEEERKDQFVFAIDGGPDYPDLLVQPVVTFRSLYAVFAYLGTLVRLASQTDRMPLLYDPHLAYAGGDDHLFPIVNRTSHCFISSDVDGRPWCVPDNAYRAKSALAILQLLLQRNTKRIDLPSSAISVQF